MLVKATTIDIFQAGQLAKGGFLEAYYSLSLLIASIIYIDTISENES
jgi:hypothetical protein